MGTKKESKQKEKAIPLVCKCGKSPCVVKLKGGYIVSCKDPEKCTGNFWTYRKPTEDAAVKAWNDLIRYGGEL